MTYSLSEREGLEDLIDEEEDNHQGWHLSSYADIYFFC